MGRGRKATSNFIGTDWETVFYNSVGTYVQKINIQQAKLYPIEPLSNHLKIFGGYAFKTADYKNQGVPIIRISDFNNEQVILKDVVYYQESKELDKFLLLEGDIIIALTGGTIAKLAIVQQGLGKIYLNQRVGKFQVIKPEEFEVEYIYWLARSIQSIIKNLAWGAAIPNVSPKQIEDLKFPFPPKKTQRGIIDFLNDLKNNEIKIDKEYFDRKTETEILYLHEQQLKTNSISKELSHQLTLVKKLRQQFLQDAVQGKLLTRVPSQKDSGESASELLKKIKAEKAKLVAEKKLKKEKEFPPIKPGEIPFEVPEGWVWCRLGAIAEIGTGATPLTSNPEYYANGNIPWITSSATNNLFVLEPEQFITEKALKETNCKVYPKGTLIVAMYGQGKTRGQITELSFPAATNQACATISLYSDDITLRKYLKLFFQKIYNEIRELAQGGAQPNLNMGKIRDTIVPLPPIQYQQRIVKKLDELMKYCDELEASIKESQVQNEKLLQQVLREALRG